MNRKRRKRRPPAYRGRGTQVNLLPILMIICLSVCAGYLTAKYVVYPLLGYEPAELNVLERLKPSSEDKTETEGDTEGTRRMSEASEKASAKAGSQADEKETERTETEMTAELKETETAPSKTVLEDKAEVKQAAGYALQFGSYSTKAAAQKSLKQLKTSGIKAKIVEKDGAYKIIGKLFDTKEQAAKHLNDLDESIGAFITTVET